MLPLYQKHGRSQPKKPWLERNSKWLHLRWNIFRRDNPVLAQYLPFIALGLLGFFLLGFLYFVIYPSSREDFKPPQSVTAGRPNNVKQERVIPPKIQKLPEDLVNAAKQKMIHRRKEPGDSENNNVIENNFVKKKYEDQKSQEKTEENSHSNEWPLGIDFENNKFDSLYQRNAVRTALLHAWHGYEQHAFGHDELRPVSNETNDSWGGFGITIVDALDTLLLLNCSREFQRAREHVANINYVKNYDASFFETTIRHFGGLLGAHYLTEGDPLFLTKAKELADRLIFAFNSTTGVPYSIINLLTGVSRNPKWNGDSSILSEYGSVQLEFSALSTLTGNSLYHEKAHKVYTVLDNAKTKFKGLYPVYLSPTTGQFTNDLVSFGSLGDSFYEYLLKTWQQKGSHDYLQQQRYEDSIEGLSEHLLRDVSSRDGSRSYSLVGEHSTGFRASQDHLLCYLPGTLASGWKSLKNDEHLLISLRLLRGCISLYASTPTGLGPERITFDGISGEKKKHDLEEEMKWWEWAGANPEDAYDELKTHPPKYSVESHRYLLRPEVIESLFHVYHATNFTFCRYFGWKIFESIVKYSTTPSSFSGLLNVNQVPPQHDNSMQSFFFAETLKYLFLLFSDGKEIQAYKGKMINPDDYVFNTEAHFLLKDLSS